MSTLNQSLVWKNKPNFASFNGPPKEKNFRRMGPPSELRDLEKMVGHIGMDRL